jgi:hypothetical protein
MNFTPELLYSMVQVLSDTGCWEFSGPKDSHGYGRLFISGKEWKAQRVAYELLVGPLPSRARLLHPLFPDRCIGASCCNPAHMKRQVQFSAIVSVERRCSQGHLINSENSVIERRGDRILTRCRICRQAAWRKTKKTSRLSARASERNVELPVHE